MKTYKKLDETTLEVSEDTIINRQYDIETIKSNLAYWNELLEKFNEKT